MGEMSILWRKGTKTIGNIAQRQHTSSEEVLSLVPFGLVPQPTGLTSTEQEKNQRSQEFVKVQKLRVFKPTLKPTC